MDQEEMTDDAKAKIKRPVRVQLASFEWLCLKTKTSRKHIHVIDVSEAVYGASAPYDKLPRRIWKMVDDILDDMLAINGYSTRIDGNRIWLLFPRMSLSLGEMKARVIASEIRLAAQKMLNLQDQAAEESADLQSGQTDQSAEFVDTLTIEEQQEQIRQARLLFESMASRKTSQSDIAIPEGFKCGFVPTWNATNNMVIGYCAELLAFVPGTAFLRPVTNAEQEMLDIAVLAASVKMMNDCVEADKLLTVTVPVQWATLDRLSTREKFLELATDIHEKGRSLMVLAVEAVPEDLLSSRIGDRLREFSAYFRVFSLTLRLGRKDFSQIAPLNIVKMHTINLGKEPWEDKVHLAELNLLMDALSLLKKPMHISNVSTKSELLASLSAGARLISGRVIPDNGKIEMRHLSLTDLYLGHAIRKEAAEKAL